MKKKATDRKIEHRDTRPEAIGSVWVFALAMLGVCIPLVAILKSATLPFFVVGAAVFVTLYVWRFGQPAPKTSEKEVEAMRQTIRDLEERLENVEVINRFEERLAEKEVRTAGSNEGEAAPREVVAVS